VLDIRSRLIPDLDFNAFVLSVECVRAPTIIDAEVRLWIRGGAVDDS
jgi:hypothetical protein